MCLNTCLPHCLSIYTSGDRPSSLCACMCQSLVNVSGVETFHTCWSRAEATAEPRADRSKIVVASGGDGRAACRPLCNRYGTERGGATPLLTNPGARRQRFRASSSHARPCVVGGSERGACDRLSHRGLLQRCVAGHLRPVPFPCKPVGSQSPSLAPRIREWLETASLRRRTTGTWPPAQHGVHRPE